MARRCGSRKAEEKDMDKHPVSREEYVRKVLDAYRQMPGTTGKVHCPDRLLAAQLYQRGVPLTTVENALVLAVARRLLRPAAAPPLATVRSLAYFLPVIEEVLNLKVSQDYFQHARHRIQRLLSDSSNPA
jgi:hypothetical protein